MSEALQRRLVVGVTGHRLDRLGAENVERVAAAADAILAEIERVAGSAAPRNLRLVTGLADGADAIFTDAALARGWTVDAALPFFRADYANDFAAGAPRAAFEQRLAACAATMELPGDRGAPEGEGVAYERAGHVMLAQSDVLIAAWDGEPARGRGGAAAIVEDAVLRGIPVIHLHPAAATPALLWDGLGEPHLGQQTADTVARGDLSGLPRLFDEIIGPADGPNGGRGSSGAGPNHPRRWTTAIAYPILLAIMGVRRFRRTDLRADDDFDRASEPIREICSGSDVFAARVHALLAPRFAVADTAATRAAQRFRSTYVSNFALAASAVVLSLLSLALPAAKPVLLGLEFSTIAAILLQTRGGNRASWHRLWLDNRALAERLRCLAISTQLGDLDLRAGLDKSPAWVVRAVRDTARELGLRGLRVDAPYLAVVRRDLVGLIDGQIAYLAADAGRMHTLEHRLHRLGTILFAVTALACIGMLAFKVATAGSHAFEELSHSLSTAATIVGAALPAIGAAIYGIRMQGDFAGAAGRSHALCRQFEVLRTIIAEDPLSFDTLSRRARRVGELLTKDLESWLQTYDARPLTLPG